MKNFFVLVLLSAGTPPLLMGGEVRCLDTALDSPHDVCRWEEAPSVAATSYVVEPRSIALLALALPKMEGSHGK